MAESNELHRFGGGIEQGVMTEQWRKVATGIAQTVETISDLTIRFAGVSRIPRFNGRRENDVEHSFMLALAATEITRAYYPGLDDALITRFSLIHDLVEVKVGDVATFDLTPEQMAEKERREKEALIELAAELPTSMAEDLLAYEEQKLPEAVFVRMVDKLLPIAVDTTGDGVKVMREDYGVNTIEQLEVSHDELYRHIAAKFGQQFPTLVAAHAELLKHFEEVYREKSIETAAPTVETRAPVEVERKFVVDLTHEQLQVIIDRQRGQYEIEQGYLAIGSDGSETRVRSFDDREFVMTVKTAGDIARGEQNVPISREQFVALYPLTEGKRIEKTRHLILHHDDSSHEYTIELDVYHGNLEGLVTTEVEFSAGGKREADAQVLAQTFLPPEWFGREVTADHNYKNQALAQNGIPRPTLDLGAKNL